MLLTNHTLTGAVLALNIQNPALLAPTAFMSHLALDSLPHVGAKMFGNSFDTTSGKVVGVADSALALTAYLLIIHQFPHQWLIITIGIFFACLPDLFYVPQVLFGVILDKGFRKLHSAVQWSQTPLGLAVDVVWGIAMIRLLQTFH